MKKFTNLFDQEGHLTDEGIAGWIDAAETSQLSALPDEIISHVETCLRCKGLIIELREALHEADQVTDEEISIRSKHGRIRYFNDKRLVRIAATVVILIAVGTLIALVTVLQKDAPESLFAAHFKPYDDIISVKGVEPPADSIDLIRRIGFSFYNREQYDSAVSAFRFLQSSGYPSDTNSFYLAIAILGTTRSPDEAIIILKDLSGGNSVFKVQSAWYLALAYLKMNKPVEAVKELKLLSAESEDYREQCMKLLNELE